jgi:fatty acid desaturase
MYIRQIGGLSISKTEIQKLSRLNPLSALAAIFFEWSLIILAILLYVYYSHPLVYLFVWLVIGSRMYALYSLLHDGLHYLLFRDRKVNDAVSRLFLAWPLFISMTTMRKNHLAHHQHLQTDDDPERVHLKYPEFQFPRPAEALALTFIQDITGVNFIRYRVGSLFRFRLSAPGSPEKKYQWLYYGVILTLVLYTGSWLQFLLCWIVPYMTIYQALNRLRLSTEHFLGEEENTPFRTRTVNLNYFEGILLSPHNLGYHTEHHLYPSVPFYRLPALHRVLMDAPEYRDNALVSSSYFSVIRAYIKKH